MAPLRHVLRIALVGTVAVGYLAVLGATAAGQGLRLIPHLLLDHVETASAAPQLAESPDDDFAPVTTLRPSVHRHGDHSHGHGSPHEHRHPAPSSIQADAAPGVGLHEHDGVVHTHAPADPPPAVVLVTVDDHRPSTATTRAALPPSGVDQSTVEARAESEALAVETPPPVGRG